MKRRDRVYSIENISENQLIVMMRALDTYSRLGMLQLEKALLDEIQLSEDYDFVSNNQNYSIDAVILHLKKNVVRCHKNPEIQKMAEHDRDGWNLGIGEETVPTNCKIAYELYKVIDHKHWEDGENKSWCTSANEGLTLTSETKITIKSQTVRTAKIKEILK